MKRLLVFAAAAGMAVSLFADRSFLSGTGFERYYEAGPVNLPQTSENSANWWSGNVGEDMATITNYDSVVTAPVVTPETYFPTGYEEKDYLTDGANSQYLALDTGSSVLTRTLQDGNASIGDDGLYVDTFVQFTASDTEPDVGSDDQILVWLHADPENAAVTNLVITAGYHYLDGNTARTLRTHYLVKDVEIEENEWYRLTIVASVAKYIGYDTAQFKVYVDDKQVEGAYLDENSEEKTKKIFPSLKWGTATLQYVGFAGQGAVDNIVFGTETPFPLTEIAYTITPGEGVASFTYQVGDGVVKTVDPAAEVTLTNTLFIGKTITITPTYEVGYQGEETFAPEITVDDNGVGSYSFSASLSAFAVTIDGGDETTYTTFTEVKNAISEAATEATITLNADYTLKDGDALEIENKSITLDLNGKTLTANYDGATIITVLEESGNFMLKDSAGGGVLKFADGVVPDGYLIENQNQSILTIGVKGDSNVFTLANGVVKNDEGGTLKIYGGQFSDKPVTDGELGDVEISDFTDICPTGYTLKSNGDYYVLTRSGDSSGDITIDSFECDFTVDTDTAAAITEATGVGTTEDNFAKAAIAYVVGGSLDENDEVVIPTPTITVDGTTVTVTYDSEDAHETGYTVKCTLYAYDLATGTKTPVAEGTIGNGLKDKNASAASKFYVVGVTVEDAQ